MTQVLVIPVRGPIYIEEIKEPHLPELQRLVGGYIEMTVVEIAGERHDVIFNEEGKVRDGFELNPLATFLCAPSLFPGDWVAGAAVFATTDAEGNTTDVKRSLLDDLREHGAIIAFDE